MTLSIEPGEIAVLSTEELITMPPDLAGRVTIKFTYACQGLITLFGSQVDPFYGRDFRTAVERKEAGNDLEYDGQRLYLLVMNAFRGQININLEDDNARRMFVFDIYKVYGTPASSGPSRPNMDKQIRRKIQIDGSPLVGVMQHVSNLAAQLEKADRKMEDAIKDIKEREEKVASQMTRIQAREKSFDRLMWSGFVAVLLVYLTIVGPQVVSVFFREKREVFERVHINPPVVVAVRSGRILRIDLDQMEVWLDLGRSDGIRMGQLMMVKRRTIEKGAEEFLGTVQIIGVDQLESRGVILIRKKPRAMGDIVVPIETSPVTQLLTDTVR